jgi:hypothetical protein
LAAFDGGGRCSNDFMSMANNGELVHDNKHIQFIQDEYAAIIFL